MKKKIALIVMGVFIVLAGVISITYAFFSAGGVQEQANTFTSGCLNISLTNESTSIHLTNVYPITDIEGLETTSYDFTVKNNCNSSANYQINLESLNEQVNSLNADYIKVSLSSDTVDNVISILSSNTSVTPTIDNAYESYNLYTDSLNANEEKTYHLKIWVDYDATVEEAANKVYQSKINVIANPETTVVDTLEAQFNLENKTITSTLTDNVTSASYCITTNNICTPDISASILNNEFQIKIDNDQREVNTALGKILVNIPTTQIACAKLNESSKIICSNLVSLPNFNKTAQENCDGKNNCEETNGVYEELTDKGITYYFRGAVENNWVKFAGFYWRIIRINENGSIRLIYSGDSESGPVTTGAESAIGISYYSLNHDVYADNAYVGYMYGTPGSTTFNETHSNINSSGIKLILDDWYEKNILLYADKLDENTGFCGDREITYGTGLMTSVTNYSSFYRLSTLKKPIYNCSNERDLYTTKESTNGNKALDYPIGLISADEVSYAGGVYETGNQSYYLYSNRIIWTISPRRFNGTTALMMDIYTNGAINSASVPSMYDVRPVINLSSDVTITGSGTISDPYTVVEN